MAPRQVKCPKAKESRVERKRREAKKEEEEEKWKELPGIVKFLHLTLCKMSLELFLLQALALESSHKKNG